MSLLSLIGKIGSAAVDVATGNIGGAVTSIFGGGTSSKPVIGPTIPSMGTLPMPDSVKVKSGRITTIGPGGSLFATGTGPEATAYYSSPAQTSTCGDGGHGTHRNKTSYRLKDGTLVAKGSKCVKNRRRNPLNPRALNRAVSRVAAAKHYAKMLDRIEIKRRTSRR